MPKSRWTPVDEKSCSPKHQIFMIFGTKFLHKIFNISAVTWRNPPISFSGESWGSWHQNILNSQLCISSGSSRKSRISKNTFFKNVTSENPKIRQFFPVHEEVYNIKLPWFTGILGLRHSVLRKFCLNKFLKRLTFLGNCLNFIAW